MPRASVLGLTAVAALGVALAVLPARAQVIHRHGFAGRQTALVRGDANVRVEVKEHAVSTQAFHSQPSSEHIKLVSDAAAGDAAYIHYVYDTPHAPVSEILSASVWVKATKGGVQLRARVVFPKEPDPERPESALTMLIVGKTYSAEKARSWDKLTIENVPELIGKYLPVVQTKTRRAVNTDGAYIDRLILNVYAGPGPIDVWVDDLDIGPVKPNTKPDAANGGVPGKTTSRPGEAAVTMRSTRSVEHRDRQIVVDGKAVFFRAIRHTGTPLHVLRSAGFDALWLPPDATPELIDEANREGWFVIPSAPVATRRAADGPEVQKDADALIGFMRKFSGSDVLFWDLGGGRTAEQVENVAGTAEVIRDRDPRRPRGADLWDGFQAYSQYLDVVGAHRWPLFTSLEMTTYSNWLEQRRKLTSGRATFWTWVQNHLPDWYMAQVMGNQTAETFNDPIGPHPEQVRQLAYISLAAGCRGIGFWSDRFLADTHHGRDRLQGMALLNAELDMLGPVILAAQDEPQWVYTNHPNVRAAVIRGQRGLLVLPIWFGPGNQSVPEQGAVKELIINVPTVPDGADPWRISPAGVECLRHRVEKKVTGTELRIDEFDLVTPIVFTADQTPTGLVVWWQDYARKYGRLAARWSLDMAAVEYEKVRTVHQKLGGMGVHVRNADQLLQEAAKFHREAQKHFANDMYLKAHQDATRALRPLRVLMRDHWQQATATLDVPTASPFAVSYFSLPQHWELARELQTCMVSPSALRHGDFELGGEIPKEGVGVNQLPGWSARFGALEVDRTEVAASVVKSSGLEVVREPRKSPPITRSIFAPGRTIVPTDEGYAPPTPELGAGVLKLQVRAKTLLDREGKPRPAAPVLERTFLAVDSPPVKLPPGTLVRISAWVKVAGNIEGSADGVLFYDDAGGEPLAVRLTHTSEGGFPVWKRYHLYRRVPLSGQIGVTMALTGRGVVYFDDVRIEPLVPGAREAASGYGSALSPLPRGATGPLRPAVVPAGGVVRP
ncbi:MAG TPA: hypothetical protein VMZ71_13570 [Gemmataceae bacterium]|nr:hypothetical protein [Gemmataceae bacterium]